MASFVPQRLLIICIACFLFLFPVVFPGELKNDRFETIDPVAKIEKRQLVGSSPPTCSGKCEGCNPCTRVLVEVPPANLVAPQWFYMVWRCTCGGKLYMPDIAPTHG
ncbi:EPIDERMAL PATTERNING FACTOR-like protein 3 [Primulina huaijiensis]|uniref:EPIDERMAL PATTERNING FACTOR-like protein 3 n=1 Tax=Primulina huaijiensis TaxID=1492673 RepID=UPI003CC72EC5